MGTIFTVHVECQDPKRSLSFSHLMLSRTRSQIFCKATMKQSLIKPWPLVALIILLSVSIVDAVTSHQSWGITSPSLLKRSFFHKLSDLRRRRRQVGASDAITTDGIPTGSNNANNIENAVFCVRGGGANGPCIGIDLGML